MGCGTSSPVVIRPDIIVDEAVKHYQTQVSLRGTEQAHLSISDDLKDQTREDVDRVFVLLDEKFKVMHADQHPQILWLRNNGAVGSWIPPAISPNAGCIWTHQIQKLSLEYTTSRILITDWLDALPALNYLNCMWSIALQSVPHSFVTEAELRPEFQLYLHQCDLLVSPPLQITGCKNADEFADLAAMRRWWELEGKTAVHKPRTRRQSNATLAGAEKWRQGPTLQTASNRSRRGSVSGVIGHKPENDKLQARRGSRSG